MQNRFLELPKTAENKDKIIITPKLMNEFREIDDHLDECR